MSEDERSELKAKRPCPACERLTRLIGKPSKCLKHDETLSEEWRRKVRVPFEGIDDADSKEQQRSDGTPDSRGLA